MTSLKRGSVTGKALSHIYLHKVDFAYLLVCNQSLTTASESRLFSYDMIAVTNLVEENKHKQAQLEFCNMDNFMFNRYLK